MMDMQPERPGCTFKTLEMDEVRPFPLALLLKEGTSRSIAIYAQLIKMDLSKPSSSPHFLLR